MKVLNLSTTDKQGAGFFASYFNALLNTKGFDSYLLVKTIQTSQYDKNVLEYNHLKTENLIGKFKRSRIRKKYSDSDFVKKYIFYNLFEQTTCYSSKSILKQIPIIPDVIIIHWVSGFINSKLIHELKAATNAQIIILMLDNSPITGGCHYPWDCDGYKESCNNCPAIYSNKKTLAQKNFSFKKKYLSDDMKVIAFSKTDYKRLNSSALFKNNPKFSLIASVDQNKFEPIFDKEVLVKLKNKYNISTEKTIILIAATFLDEERKGMIYIQRALEILNKNDFFLLIAGNNSLDIENYNHKTLGYLSENELIDAFRIADVFACPTIEDSGPIMINQSLMTGTPVVAFKTGVAEDIVIENKSGFLAEKRNHLEFANCLQKIISQTDIERSKMSENCRKIALDLYSEEIFFNNLKRIIKFSI